jgi:hypothetical protein
MMPWIKVDTTATEHRKIRKLAKELGMPAPHVLGHLVHFWCKVLEQAPDGNLKDWSFEDVEHAARWHGGHGQFYEAMGAAGLLDGGPDDLHVHDWEVYAGEYLKGLQRSREWKQRTKKKDTYPDTCPDTSPDTAEKRREEKRREETLKTPAAKKPPPPLVRWIKGHSWGWKDGHRVDFAQRMSEYTRMDYGRCLATIMECLVKDDPGKYLHKMLTENLMPTDDAWLRSKQEQAKGRKDRTGIKSMGAELSRHRKKVKEIRDGEAT